MVKAITSVTTVLNSLAALMLAGLAFKAAAERVAREFGITPAEVRRLARAAGWRW